MLCCLQALGKHLPHGHTCAHTHTHARRTTGIIGRFPHGFRRLILTVFAQITHHPHGSAAIHGLFHFFRQADVFNHKAAQLQPQGSQLRVDGL